MYSISRQTGCRLAFVLLGILPLLVTFVIAGWRNRQFDEAHFASLVSRVLGCRTTIDAVKFVRPGIVRLENVNVRDAETGEPFLSLPRVDVQQGQQNLQLAVSEARVHDFAVDRLLFLIHERVLRQPALLAEPILVTVERFHFSRRLLDSGERDASDPATYFVQNRFELRQIERGSELRGELRQAAANVKPAMDLTIRRTLADLPTTTITWQTHDQWMTAGLLVGRQAWLPRLSASAKFRGNLHMDLDADGWSGEVYGDLQDVDLGQLVGDRFGRFLTGNAHVFVRKARFVKSRLQEFHADIDAGPGQLGTRQLKSAAAAWQLEWSDPPELDATSIDYQQLAASIYLNKKGLELTGLCPENSGILLTVPSGAVLRHPQSQGVKAEVRSIFDVLLPAASAPQFQLTAEADSLMRFLPLPTANDADVQQ